jgi:AraC-like DNA-binding protein
MGRTFTDYLNEVRIDAACRLLVETELPVTVVAARCGYRNLSHFNRRFLRRKGTQPRWYRRQYRPAAVSDASAAAAVNP